MTGPDALSFDPFAGFEPSPSANPANPVKAQSLSASSRLAANANPANPDGTGDKNEGGLARLARPANRKDPDNDLGLAGLAGLAGGQPLGRDSLLPEAEGDPPPWWCQTLVPPPGAACSCCQGRRWWNEREGGDWLALRHLPPAQSPASAGRAMAMIPAETQALTKPARWEPNRRDPERIHAEKSEIVHPLGRMVRVSLAPLTSRLLKKTYDPRP